MPSNYYRHGDHNIICDRCGRKIKASQSRKTWDNLVVCPEDWEPRHPQDVIRIRAEEPGVKDPRPRPDDYFLSDNEVTADSL